MTLLNGASDGCNSWLVQLDLSAFANPISKRLRMLCCFIAMRIRNIPPLCKPR
jgi:hypothetical protein